MFYRFLCTLLNNFLCLLDSELFYPKNLKEAPKLHTQKLNSLIVNGEKYAPPESILAYLRSVLPSGEAHPFLLTS